MKNFTLILFILGMGKIASAQWTTSGSDIYSSNSGNVGVGTSSPYTKFEVIGGSSYPVAASSSQRYIYQLRNSSNTNNAAYGWWLGQNNNGSFFLHQDGIGDRLTVDVNGYVGVGTTSPTTLLTLGSTTATENNQVLRIYRGGSGSNYSEFTNNGGATEIRQNGIDGVPGVILFKTKANDEGSYTEQMRIQGNGNVGIGTTDPQGYKLAVNSNMIAESVKVKLHSNWPDHVFESSYKLPDLRETEQFIKENKHLPEIPSASQVEKDGINLGEMNAKLLQKIEELTLHIIELNKRMEKVEKPALEP